MSDRVQRIRTAIEQALRPEFVDIQDESHLHRGHAGAQDGRGHYHVLVVADAFMGKNRLARHRLVYSAVGEMMTTDIHALRMDLYASDEFDEN